MTYKKISSRLGSAIRRRRQRAWNRHVHRRASVDLARLSQHTLRDLGYRRDGEWIGRDLDY